MLYINVYTSIIMNKKDSLYQIEKQLFRCAEMNDSKSTIALEDLRTDRWIHLLRQFEYNRENAVLLSALNDRLIQATKQLYSRMQDTQKRMNMVFPPNADCYVSGNIYLKNDLPARYPDQSEHARKVWEALMTDNCCLEGGIGWTLSFNLGDEGLNYPTLMDYLGMEDENDSWNEHLDREWSQPLHLVNIFHNLFSHCELAIQDLIYIDDFYIQIEMIEQEDVKIAPLNL